MLKSYHVAFVLALLVPLTHAVPADASPSSGGFKSGFSSQRSSSSSSSAARPSYSSAKSGSFGSFSRRASSSDGAAAAAPPSRSSGGFGSFGGGPAAPRKSDSALSQQLNKNAAEANALRTLDARKQAQEQSARDTRPVPGYEQGASGQSAPAYAPPPAAPQPQAPIIVRQDSGLGHVVAGAVLANAMRGAHATNNGYPGGYAGNGGGYGPAPARGGGTSFFGLFVTLCVLALIGWMIYFAWRRMRRAREAKKPNYSFERN
jgi:hypothetical protein